MNPEDHQRQDRIKIAAWYRHHSGIGVLKPVSPECYCTMSRACDPCREIAYRELFGKG